MICIAQMRPRGSEPRGARTIALHLLFLDNNNIFNSFLLDALRVLNGGLTILALETYLFLSIIFFFRSLLAADIVKCIVCVMCLVTTASPGFAARFGASSLLNWREASSGGAILDIIIIYGC